jgi:hypothetical protein
MVEMTLLPMPHIWNNDPDRTITWSNWQIFRDVARKRLGTDGAGRLLGQDPATRERLIDQMVGMSGRHLRDPLRPLRETAVRAVSLPALPVPPTLITGTINAVRREMLPVAQNDAIWLARIAEVRATALPDTVLNHFALNEGLSLMILVVPDQVTSNLCRQEIGVWLGRQARRVVDLSPDDPAALRRLATTLLEQPDSADLGCVWFGAAHAEDRAAWEEAWRWGLGTLNQHRNSLRERFACTVVTAGPPWLVPLFRDVAPDLWSVRTVVAWIETDTNRIAGDFRPTTKQVRKPPGLLG